MAHYGNATKLKNKKRGICVGWSAETWSLTRKPGFEKSNPIAASFDIMSGRYFDRGVSRFLGDFGFKKGDYLMVASDLDAGKIWFGKNGVWLNNGNPATGANPSITYVGLAATELFPTVVFRRPSNGKVTLRTSSGELHESPPSGFSVL